MVAHYITPNNAAVARLDIESFCCADNSFSLKTGINNRLVNFFHYLEAEATEYLLTKSIVSKRFFINRTKPIKEVLKNKILGQVSSSVSFLRKKRLVTRKIIEMFSVLAQKLYLLKSRFNKVIIDCLNNAETKFCLSRILFNDNHVEIFYLYNCVKQNVFNNQVRTNKKGVEYYAKMLLPRNINRIINCYELYIKEFEIS